MVSQPKYIIYGTHEYSVVEISYALSALRVSHDVEFKSHSAHVDRRKTQPKNVVVTDNPKGFKKGCVNFITAPGAALDLTNWPRLRGPIREALKKALIAQVSVVPSTKILSYIDYVNLVAKPSVLNLIQTEVYKINPYALRKQTHQIVLDYLNSRISKRNLKDMLSKNLKHEALLPLLLSADSLRSAVAMVGKKTVEEIEAETGHPTFELLYLSKERK